LAIAKTGSGKTLGFLLPALTRCLREKEAAKGSPVCLIMAPTRELALQIVSEASKFLDCGTGCRTVAVYGGAPKDKQIREVKRGCEMVVATPGRLMDLLGNHGQDATVDLSCVSILVLDEADRMLDMGFEKDIRSIAWQLPAARQTLFYSATWPADGRPDITGVTTIAAELLSNPVKVTVGAGDVKLTANKAVTQRVRVLDATGKF
jgi:ATP-dependent RNA helicase DDX5/DBP2